ncbi:hypothetical protein AC482_05930 [miscellaneous Crenarchaeota group-15 archaeon DG-45]|uniref:VWFA domain-containing protein n=1 Tax=miscellaneous Crenarchaeota group-15 archaeon DG-45 TaxID=1685127 RepID=A0A0M0BMU1_9ARCH|nr:MAG: hypothetical protein AC482_05930 [miscellaneous Crenarchaeota group-15 archaeon DG-45]
MRRPTSEDRRLYVASFEVEGAGRLGRGVYIDGAYTSRSFVSEDEAELRQRIEGLIEEGHLTLDAEGAVRPALVSVERRGDAVAVRLRGPPSEEPRRRLIVPGPSEGRRRRMHPVLDYDVAHRVREMLEKDRFYEFVELLESFTHLIEEREVTPFDGRTIHPVSTRTLLSEMTVYSKGLRPRHRREERTAILLDRSVSMANAWALWEEYPKIRVGRFLAKVIEALQTNNALYSFGADLRREGAPDAVEAEDGETRLDLALGEVALLEPERLVVITDGRPVYSEALDTEALCDSAVEMLDAMGRSRVLVLAVLLGYDYDMARFYQRLEMNPSVALIELAAGGDIVKMMHKLADWL